MPSAWHMRVSVLRLIFMIESSRNATRSVSFFTGMLASGRAILATASPETQISYVLEGCGLVVPPESPETVAEGLRRLADDAPMRAHGPGGKGVCRGSP